MKNIRIKSDGTSAGTKIYAGDVEIKSVTSLVIKCDALNDVKVWLEVIPESLDIVSELVETKTNEKFSTCQGCGKRVSIDTNRGRHDDCNWIYGIRGWRQLGSYDG